MTSDTLEPRDVRPSSLRLRGGFAAAPFVSGLVGLALLISVPPAVQSQEPEEERAETECLCVPMGQFSFPEGLSEEMRGELQERMSDLRERMFMRDGDRIRGEARAPRLGTIRPGQLLRQRTGAARFGVRLHDLNPELGRYFDSQEGVLVLEVDGEAPLPLEEGDVVLSIDGRPLLDAAHARQILSSYRPGEAISLELRREGRTLTVEGTAP